MQPFLYDRATTLAGAVKAATAGAPDPARGQPTAPEGSINFLAGGTTLLDLMKLDVMRPERLVDVNGLGRTGSFSAIEATPSGLRLGGLVRMADAAAHADIRRDYPVLAQTLELAASPQIRNMASLAGNVLQRTRCSYFRDVAWTQCNKRNPGSGCAALDGMNRMHAVLGTSDACIATYPGDFAQALIALGAEVEIAGPGGNRTIAFADLHRRPDTAPQVESALGAGDVITGFSIPAGPWTRRSAYVKVRDRQSYEFALASAAVALDLDGGQVRSARIALGGVATVPWRAREAEAALEGKPLDEAAAQRAADAAFAGAKGRAHNAYKIPLGKATLVRALMQVGSMET